MTASFVWTWLAKHRIESFRFFVILVKWTEFFPPCAPQCRSRCRCMFFYGTTLCFRPIRALIVVFIVREVRLVIVVRAATSFRPADDLLARGDKSRYGRVLLGELNVVPRAHITKSPGEPSWARAREY